LRSARTAASNVIYQTTSSLQRTAHSTFKSHSNEAWGNVAEDMVRTIDFIRAKVLSPPWRMSPWWACALLSRWRSFSWRCEAENSAEQHKDHVWSRLQRQAPVATLPSTSAWTLCSMPLI
jgi:hypothetical protein